MRLLLNHDYGRCRCVVNDFVVVVALLLLRLYALYRIVEETGDARDDGTTVYCCALEGSFSPFRPILFDFHLQVKDICTVLTHFQSLISSGKAKNPISSHR